MAQQTKNTATHRQKASNGIASDWLLANILDA